MSKTSMTIRTDAEVKKQAQRLFAEFGLDMTTAINMFLRQSVRNRAIPFEITMERPNAETIEAFEEGEALLKDSSARRYGSFSQILAEVSGNE